MAKVLKALPSIFRLPVLAIISTVGGFFIFGWQMEIITIWVSQGKFTFEFPWFIGGSVNIWWARDFWYAFLAVCILLFGWGAYQLGSRNILALIRKR